MSDISNKVMFCLEKWIKGCKNGQKCRVIHIMSTKQPLYPHYLSKSVRDGKIIGKVGIKLTNNDPCPTGRRRRCFILRYIGIRNERTDFEEFFSRKTKKGQRL